MSTLLPNLPTCYCNTEKCSKIEVSAERSNEQAQRKQKALATIDFSSLNCCRCSQGTLSCKKLGPSVPNLRMISAWERRRIFCTSQGAVPVCRQCRSSFMKLRRWSVEIRLERYESRCKGCAQPQRLPIRIPSWSHLYGRYLSASITWQLCCRSQKSNDRSNAACRCLFYKSKMVITNCPCIARGPSSGRSSCEKSGAIKARQACADLSWCYWRVPRMLERGATIYSLTSTHETLQVQSVPVLQYTTIYPQTLPACTRSWDAQPTPSRRHSCTPPATS